MTRKVGFLIAGVLLVAAPQSVGQVVQLPGAHSFSVGTTVVVPDRGGIYLGGVRRAEWRESFQGIPLLSHVPGGGRAFGNRGFVDRVSSTDVSVTATIIDLSELDAAVRMEAARSNKLRDAPSPIAEKAAFLTRHIGRRTTGQQKTPTRFPATASPAHGPNP